jgi:hypothetical protein
MDSKFRGQLGRLRSRTPRRFQCLCTTDRSHAHIVKKMDRRKKVDFAVDKMNYWHDKLVKSLHMRYFHEGMWKTQKQMSDVVVGDVVAHPMFDPEVEAAMDRDVGKSVGNIIYKKAFANSKPRADRMLDAFSKMQKVINSRIFLNAIARFAAFAPEAAKELAKKHNTHELASAQPPPKSG